MPELTNEELDLLGKILANVDESRSCLSVAEQLNLAYREDGTFDNEKADWVEHVFNGLNSKFNEE